MVVTPRLLLRAVAHDAIGNALSPSRCAACAQLTSSRSVFCGTCATSVVPTSEPSVADGVALYAYGGAMADAVTAFKYGGRPDLGRPLGDLLRRAVTFFEDDRPRLVVPVPLHPSRLRERGFNQAALLAAPVARDLGAIFAARALVRTRDTATQTTLARDARYTNVDGAFSARIPASFVGADVLLVDDVRTTGATLTACTDAARRAGAKRVRTLVLAQAE